MNLFLNCALIMKMSHLFDALISNYQCTQYLPEQIHSVHTSFAFLAGFTVIDKSTIEITIQLFLDVP